MLWTSRLASASLPGLKPITPLQCGATFRPIRRGLIPSPSVKFPGPSCAGTDSTMQRMVVSSVDGPCSARVKLALSDDLSGCGHLSGLFARR
jgi:hypothetical protein